MFIVLCPSMEEFSKNPQVKTFNDEAEVIRFLLLYRGDIERLKIYQAEEYYCNLSLSKPDAET